MRKEKLVKKQAREALRGNTIPIIAGISLAAMIFIMLQNALYLIWLSFNAIDVETEQMKDGFELPYLLGTAAVVIAATLLSPFVNGAYKAAANAVSENNCEVTDLFYFFRGARRYLKTMVINMGLFLFFGTLNLLFGFGIKSLFGADGALGVVGAVIGGMITFLLYSLILHYPLCLYGIDDSRSAARYIFGYLGFSFRHFWAFIRLTFSMLGWILLCFFVAPVFYVGPYALCAAVNSARWLKISDEEKAAKKYIPQPVYTGYTEYTGF